MEEFWKINTLIKKIMDKKDFLVVKDAQQGNEKKRARSQAILLGLGTPILLTIVIYLLRPDPIKWLFADTSKLVTTNGIVTVSYIELRGSPAFNAVGWHYVIQYEYSVKGKMYTSNIVSYGDTGSSDKSYAEEYIKKYPEGKSILVYYDPLRPEKPVLEPWIKDYQILYLIGGALLFGIFIIVLSFYIR